MRHQTKTFLKEFFKKQEIEVMGLKVLDVGSLDVNGSVRDVLEGSHYVGLDLRAGPNVDIVLDAHDLKSKFEEGQFDLVICFDVLEHDSKFWVTVENMKWVLKNGGWLLIGVPGRGCPYHEHPSDYWRFMEPAVGIMLEEFVDTYIETQYDDDNHELEDEIYGYGRKP